MDSQEVFLLVREVWSLVGSVVRMLWFVVARSLAICVVMVRYVSTIDWLCMVRGVDGWWWWRRKEIMSEYG